MNNETIYKKLNEIFRDVLDDEDITVIETTTADDIEEWDSLEHINLIVAIEKTFDVKFDIKEVSDMKNVGDMVKAIMLKVN